MSFDLNLDNYTKKELVEMFDLPSNYDRNILDMKESKLRESIVNNKEINTNTKEKTIQFLVKAKTILLNNHNTLNNKNPITDLKETIMGIYNTDYELKPTKLENSQEHMVQTRKPAPFVSSNPGEFFPGVINPLSKGTIRNQLNIDSRFRDNYFASPSTNFNVILPTNFNNVLQMQLTAIELPTTFYIFSKQYNNNFFTITVNTLTRSPVA